MGVRENFLDAMEDERIARDALNSAIGNRVHYSNLYYKEKYGIGPGSIVYTNDERQTEIKIESFEIWNRNIDVKPDVVGYLKLPFAWSKKPHLFKSNEWVIVEEAANGNK